jgi:hypothetical protein
MQNATFETGLTAAAERLEVVVERSAAYNTIHIVFSA